MKLTRVKIDNFRSIKSMDFAFPESGFLVLVGANNAGKSNVIRAINNIFGVEWSRERPKSLPCRNIFVQLDLIAICVESP